MNTISFITGNENKYKEVEAILTGIDLERIDLDLTEVQSESLEEIAAHKAKEAYEKTNKPCVIEDTGFFLDAYKGFPGPFIKYIEKKFPFEGAIRLLEGQEERGAFARTCAAYYDGTNLITVIGEVKGEVLLENRGGEGFGFDPHFVPEGYTKTFAEMGEEKNEISHRKKAFDLLLIELDKLEN